jgi:hypothetical protein
MTMPISTDNSGVINAATPVEGSKPARGSLSAPPQRDFPQNKTSVDGAIHSTPSLLAPTTLSTRSLLHDVSRQIERFLLLPDPSLYEFLSLWIIATHLHKEFQHFGILNLESPTPGCGKTTGLDIIELLAYNTCPPQVAPTQAGLFHGAKDSTQLMDEIDTWSHELLQSLISILNAGFTANGVVTRLAKDDKGNYDDKRTYSAYCPKALAGIGMTIKGATRSRAFTITLKKQSREEKRERFIRSKRAVFVGLKKRIEEWAKENKNRVREVYDKDSFPYLEGFEDRTYDMSCGLAAILGAMGENPDNFLRALEIVRGETNEVAQERSVLNALLALSKDGQPVVGMASELSERTGVSEGLITATLRKYGFDTKNARLDGGEPRKRYYLDPGQLAEMNARYCVVDGPKNGHANGHFGL